MSALDGKLLSKAYLWSVSSVYGVITATVIISGLLLFASLVFEPPLFAAVAAILLFAVGLTANRVRHSGAVLDYPGIDRFFQQVPCYLSIQNRNLEVIRTNAAFREDFGDRIGEKCHLVYKGSKEICPNCPVMRTFEDGKTHTTEETVITKNGEEAQMIVYTQPVTDEHGTIVGVMEMSTNITELKRLQEQIEESRREYQYLFENVPCYISIQDKDLKIIRANKRFREEFGDPEGKHCYEVFKGRDRECPNCHVVETFEDGRIRGNESVVIGKDGTPAHIIAYSSPIYNDRGEIAGVMEMSTDITEVKKLQRELTHMGKTIAVMAHRIKNILMGLEGGIYVVNTGMEDGDDSLVKQGWGMIQRNVENVSRIVKDLLYCSKEREMEFKQIDPTEVVRNVYELFEGRAQKDGISLKLDIPESMPVGRFDPDALHSLFTNLVTNAFDACVNDATEGKDSHHISIRGTMENSGKYVFEIEDNGPGIPGQVGETVFEDFFSTKGREGTGLGLLVAQKVSEAHGGVITFKSSGDEGTVFRAVFPVKS